MLSSALASSRWMWISRVSPLVREITLLLVFIGVCVCAEKDIFPEMLKRSGLGFLSNTGDKADLNVRIADQVPRKDGLGTKWMFLVATRAIAAHDEILSPYNNWDPAIV